MTQKEKLTFVKQWYNDSLTTAEEKLFLEWLFPDLKKNEDERIKEELLDYLKRFIPHCDIDLVKKSKIWIAWIEKQEKIADEYEDKLDRCACESFDKGYKAAIEKQSNWKPSMAQIESLRVVLQTIPYSKDKENILVILKELSKL